MTHRHRTLPVIKTLRCQMCQLYTTLLHQHARLVEDAASGCIRAQPASGKRKCAACCMCGILFSHDCSFHPRHTRPTGPNAQCPSLSLGLLSTPQSLRTFRLTWAPLSVFVDVGVDSCALRALAVMVTPHTHCHFTMQARALHVPELCDDHTPPPCLVTNSLAKSGYRSVNTLVLPDPLLTQQGLVPSQASALYNSRQVV